MIFWKDLWLLQTERDFQLCTTVGLILITPPPSYNPGWSTFGEKRKIIKPRFETFGEKRKIIKPWHEILARRRRENFQLFGCIARGKRYFRGPKEGNKSAHICLKKRKIIRPRLVKLAEKRKIIKPRVEDLEIFQDFQP